MISEYLNTQNSNYICNEHKCHINEKPLCPHRYKCKECKKKKINGYSNPDHICNPFGYLYLVPTLCIDCANKNNKCMWC